MSEPQHIRASVAAQAAMAEYAEKGHARITHATLRGMLAAEAALRKQYRWRPFKRESA